MYRRAHQSPDVRPNSFKRTLHRDGILHTKYTKRYIADFYAVEETDAIFILVYPRLFFFLFAHVNVVSLHLARTI